MFSVGMNFVVVQGECAFFSVVLYVSFLLGSISMCSGDGCSRELGCTSLFVTTVYLLFILLSGVDGRI